MKAANTRTCAPRRAGSARFCLQEKLRQQHLATQDHQATAQHRPSSPRAASVPGPGRGHSATSTATAHETQAAPAISAPWPSSRREATTDWKLCWAFLAQRPTPTCVAQPGGGWGDTSQRASRRVAVSTDRPRAGPQALPCLSPWRPHHIHGSRFPTPHHSQGHRQPLGSPMLLACGPQVGAPTTPA